MIALWVHQFRREEQAVQERAEALIALCGEQGFALFSAWGNIEQGWALSEQGQVEEGIARIREGLAAHRTTGAERNGTKYLALLAEAYGKAGRAEEGLPMLDGALAAADSSRERFYEAELYRLKGTLTLQKFQVSGSKFQVANTHHPAPKRRRKQKRFFSRPSRSLAARAQSLWSCGR